MWTCSGFHLNIGRHVSPQSLNCKWDVTLKKEVTKRICFSQPWTISCYISMYAYKYVHQWCAVVFWNEEAKFNFFFFLSNVNSCPTSYCYRGIVSSHVTFPIHSQLPPTKLNGLRGVCVSHCNFSCWCRCCTILMLYNISYEKQMIYTLFNVIFCNFCIF